MKPKHELYADSPYSLAGPLGFGSVRSEGKLEQIDALRLKREVAARRVRILLPLERPSELVAACLDILAALSARHGETYRT
jgi:hypothetical protein